MGHCPGKDLEGYVITEALGGGGGTPELYIAEKGGTKVFLKDYGNLFKPEQDSCFQRYIDYEDKLRKTIETFMTSDPMFAKKTDDGKRILRKLVYKIYDFKHICETKKMRNGKILKKHYYIQAFEFISPRLDLKQYLAGVSLTPSERFMIANIFMGAICFLHEAKIVHCDLKPENVCLVNQGGVYNPKLIDFDKSFFDGDDLSWISPEQKIQGYSLGAAGSPGYFSPEHLKYEAPCLASDIFTCGLILYEILSKTGHPYWDTKTSTDPEKEAAYQEAVLAHKAVKPQLYDWSGVPNMTKDKALAIADVMYRCLELDPKKRPTAREIKDILIFGKVMGGKPPMGHGPGTTSGVPVTSRIPPSPPIKPTAPKTGVTPKPTAPKTAVPPKPTVTTTAGKPLVLKGANGAEKRIQLATFLGRRSLSQFGEESKYLGDRQFNLILDKGEWYIEHIAGNVNQTMLNGAPIAGKALLKNGDVISLGKSGVLPIDVNIS